MNKAAFRAAFLLEINLDDQMEAKARAVVSGVLHFHCADGTTVDAPFTGEVTDPEQIRALLALKPEA